jgi:transcriptional regulator with XRE-family HTH domain
MPAVDTVFAEHVDNELPATSPEIVADSGRPTHGPEVAGQLRHTFCAELRRARERKGISLDHIAQTTKVSGLLFAELEQCDLSRWPSGIYRRSFFRDYVTFTGLPVESTTSEFVRLFPEEIGQASARGVAPGPLRLELAPAAWIQPSLSRSRAAVIDATVVLLATALAVWALAVSPWSAVAVVALSYHLVATVLLGCSPGTWLTLHRGQLTRWSSRLSR